MAETSTKPYFLRALHEWCTDNGFTPHIVVQVDEHTRVPVNFVRDGQITLNIGESATNRLVMGNEFIEFQARFGGKTETIWAPVGAVTAIYARETGTGMGFEVEASTATPNPSAASISDADGPAEASSDEENSAKEKSKRPQLKIVK
ncbi:MAG: ClpXP protease specificity-enhancing factor [Orrella sp.]